MSTLGPEEIDPAPFAGARLFHVSGITPALGDRCRAATFAALEAARAAGCAVSFDPNYRSRLWSLDAARAVYAQILPQVDILFATREALDTFFGVGGADDEAAARAALAAFPGLKAVALTSREQAHAFRGTIGALAATRDQTYRARPYDLEIIDRLGAGDAFAAGFLWGFLRDDPARGVAYGQALAALQHTIPGDFPTSPWPKSPNWPRPPAPARCASVADRGKGRTGTTKAPRPQRTQSGSSSPNSKITVLLCVLCGSVSSLPIHAPVLGG